MTRHALIAVALALAPAAVAQIPKDFAVPSVAFDATALPKGYEPSAARAADFDGDGVLDVAVTTWPDQPVLALLKGRGDGGFYPPSLYILPMGALDLAVADFDADGDLDVAAGATGKTYEGSSIGVMKNDGTGALAAPASVACGGAPAGIVAADLDLDGDVDLATAHGAWLVASHTIAWMRNLGGGTFGVPAVLPAASDPRKIAAADLDGDGLPELVLGHPGGRASILFNGGASPFQFAATLTAPHSSYLDPGLAVADADGDGDADVLLSGEDWLNKTSWIELFRNQGAATFSAATSLPLAAGVSGAVDVAVADVTGDGMEDVLGADFIDGQWSLLASSGNGIFQAARSFHATYGAIAVQAVDVDGDADLDVLLLGKHSLDLAVFENPGGGAFPQPAPLAMGDPLAPGAYSALGFGDLDGDGDSDLALAWKDDQGGTGARVALRFQQPGGAWSPPTQLPAPAFFHDLEVADVDGDGRCDLLGADAASPTQLRLARGLGNGAFAAFAAGPSLPCGPGVLETGDLDQDGDLDAAWCGAGGCSSVWISKWSGSAFGTPVAQPVSQSADAAALGDVDADGDLDLATNGGMLQLPEVSLARGDGSFDPPAGVPAVVPMIGTTALAIADVDGDGLGDLLALAGTTGPDGSALAVLRSAGNGGFDAPETYAAASDHGAEQIQSVVAADVDGDGAVDVLAPGFDAQEVSLWRNHGDGTFESQAHLGVGDRAYDLAVGDVTGDGKVDLVVEVAAEGAGEWAYGAVSIFAGTGAAKWTDVGYALAGGSGSPKLSGSGVLQVGGVITLRLEHLPPSASVVLLAGLAPALVPFLGGTLVPQPSLVLPLPGGPGGSLQLQATVPVVLPSGFALYAQAWLQDPGGIFGWAASNGVRGTTP